MKRLCSGFGFAFALFLSSCSSAPPPPSTAAAAQTKSSRTERVRLICNDSARVVPLSSLGIPEGERALEVAISDKYMWVLFEPARLLRVERDGQNVYTEMKLGEVGEVWSAMDLDPVDGSVWVTSDQQLALQKLETNWRTRTVKVQNVEGSGGFHALKVAQDAVYARPTCAETAVWRIDRSSGKVLGTAFPLREEELEAEEDPRRLLGPNLPGCAGALLERDIDRRILAWDFGQEKAFQLEPQGTWAESDTTLFEFLTTFHAPVAKGLNVGAKDEQWAVDYGIRTLFFWKGRPVFLGPWLSPAQARQHGDTLLVVPGSKGEKGRELIESCHGHPIRDIASNETSYVAVTDGALIFGDFATAPDLP